MENTYYSVTEQEMAVVKQRAAEIIGTIESGENVEDALVAYARDNGYTAEEAKELVEEAVIPTVDEYNRACREQAEGVSKEWIREKISERTENMDLADECRYRLGILVALRAAGKRILERTEKQTDDEMELEYQEILKSVSTVADQSEYTEEMLDQINDWLVDAIEGCGLELELADQMERLLSTALDEESVHGFVTEMWQDEQYKYAAAAAACIARKNDELPSIPETASDIALVVGVCQGIDVANVEMKVSTGELAVDKAYQILKGIAAVGLAIFTMAALTWTGVSLAALAGGAIVGWFGTGFVASTVAVALGGAVLFGFGVELLETVEWVTDLFGKASDFTYDKLKAGSKKLYQVVKEYAMPKLRSMVEWVAEGVEELVARIRQTVSHKVRTKNA